MGSFANTLFTIMLGWIQAAAAALWSAFTTENGGSFLQWIGKNWIMLAVILCAVGVILDLGVYLLRWRPMQVWKSYFRRLRHGKEETEEPAPAGRLFQRETAAAPVSGPRPMTAWEEREDFSRWVSEEPEPEPEPERVIRKPIITGAGYTVPADSPYRRPAEPPREDTYEEPVVTERQDELPGTRPEIMTQKKRKRRLAVGDLFNDPEEELYQYEAPQHLIDKNKAYHEPVYPRNWKKDEGENDESIVR